MVKEQKHEKNLIVYFLFNCVFFVIQNKSLTYKLISFKCNNRLKSRLKVIEWYKKKTHCVTYRKNLVLIKFNYTLSIRLNYLFIY